jgi:hypothetical protein
LLVEVPVGTPDGVVVVPAGAEGVVGVDVVGVVGVSPVGVHGMALEMAAAAAQLAAVCSILRPAEEAPAVDRPKPQPLTYAMLDLLAWMQLCKPVRAVTSSLLLCAAASAANAKTHATVANLIF